MTENLPKQPAQGKAERDALLAAMLDHVNLLPDPKEAFAVLETVRALGGITSDEAAMLMSLYWEGV